MFSLSRKACFLYKTSKIVFSRFIFAISYMAIQGVTRGYKGLQGVTKDSRNFFLTGTFPDTFFRSILHKNQS